MSLYTIAAASLTTFDDHRRRPATDAGQIARTLTLCVLVAAGLVGVHRASHANAARALAPIVAER